jgi:hypothetical protein
MYLQAAGRWQLTRCIEIAMELRFSGLEIGLEPGFADIAAVLRARRCSAEEHESHHRRFYHPPASQGREWWLYPCISRARPRKWDPSTGPLGPMTIVYRHSWKEASSTVLQNRWSRRTSTACSAHMSLMTSGVAGYLHLGSGMTPEPGGNTSTRQC